MQTFSAGVAHSLFLSSDNVVYGCGSNDSGAIGGIGRSYLLPIQLDFPSEICSVSAGNNFSLFLDSECNVWGTGYSICGQLGFIGRATVPKRVENLPAIQTVHASHNHYSVFLDQDGYVWTCGKSDFGQMGLGHINKQIIPQKINTIPRIRSVSAGSKHLLLLDEEGAVWGSGNSMYGQVSDCRRNQSTPVKIDLPIPIASVSAGNSHSMFLDIEGNVWSSGFNSKGQLGFKNVISNFSFIPVPKMITNIPKMVDISAGDITSVLLDETGKPWICEDTGPKATSLTDIERIDCPLHQLFLDKQGGTWVKGENKNGQLGLGDIKSRRFAEINPHLPSISTGRKNAVKSAMAIV